MQLATEKSGHAIQFGDILLTLNKASKDPAGLSDVIFENRRQTGTLEISRALDMTPKMLTLNMLSGPLDHGTVSDFP
jgi:hypothetical protein